MALQRLRLTCRYHMSNKCATIGRRLAYAAVGMHIREQQTYTG
jgi:hypothetical protein